MSSKLLRAISLMHTRLKIEGDSSESLANHVNRVNDGRSDAKTCSSVAALNSSLEITVADALLELARASRNPKYRSVAAIHQWWAFVRYLAFFDQSAGFLTIGEEGRSFVYNQRRVASEELGVAFSILVGRRWIASLNGPSGPVSVTDVELALAGHSHHVAQLTGRTQRPDWLLSIGDPSHPLKFANYLLESKGTANNTHAKNQLVTATRQLHSITVSGVVPKGLAVSTVTGSGKVRYMAVDPGDDPEFIEVDPEAIDARVREGQKLPKTGKVDVDIEYLTNASAYWSLVSLADFARNTEALERLGTNLRPIEDMSGTAVREHSTDLGPVDGLERSWDTPEGRLSIIVGVQSGINQQLERGDVAGAIASRANWAKQRSSVDQPMGEIKFDQEGHEGARTQSSESVNQRSVTAASNDGAILSISLFD